MSQEAATEGIHQYGNRYMAATNRNDIEAWLSNFTEDCVFMAPGAPALQGKDAVRSWATALFEQYQMQLSLDFAEIEVRGPWAFAWGRYAFKGTPKGNAEPIQQQGKFLNVLREEPDGQWKLARGAHNLDTP